MNICILDVQLLALGGGGVVPLPFDRFIIRASSLPSRVNPTQRGRGQLGRHLPDLTAGVVAEKVQLLRLVKVQGGQDVGGVGVVGRPLEDPGEVGHSVGGLAVGVNGVVNLTTKELK